MFYRNKILKLLLLAFSFYIPLSFFSFCIYILDNIFYSGGVPQANTKTEMRKIGQDIPQKLSAVLKGYIPLYYPLSTKNYANKYNIYPIGSLPMRNSFFCNEGYGLTKYKTDRFGLRNLDAKWNKVGLQENIFLIGDSFVNGACVENNSTISSNVERELGINTINLGSLSNGPYEYMAILKSMINPIIKESNNKNYVALIFYPNDKEANSRYSNLLLKTDSIIRKSPGGEISPTEHYINSIERLVKDNYYTSRQGIILRVIQQHPIYYTLSLYPIRKRLMILLSSTEKNITTTKSQSPTQRSISLLAKICNKRCIPLIVYIPNSSFWEPITQGMTQEDLDNYKDMIKKDADSNGITFIDSEEVIDRDNLDDFAQGPHLSRDSYKKLSRLISEEVRKKGNLYK